MTTTVTLLEKVYGNCSLEAFGLALASLCEGLKIQLRAISKTSRGWVQIEVSGEDEAIALNQINQKMGFAPTSRDEMSKFLTVRGRVIFSGKSSRELYVDVGVFSPEICDAAVPLENLQAQLADGKKIQLQQLVELFCLYDNMPLRVKILDHSNEGKYCIAAELSEAQINQTIRWICSNLDRLIVFSVPASHVGLAIRTSGLSRDVIGVEELGVLEHALLCKLGTDAVGLIPRLGPLLPTATFASFCPRKIQELIKGQFVP